MLGTPVVAFLPFLGVSSLKLKMRKKGNPFYGFTGEPSIESL